jgi:cyclopropane-fatty-acyl-phospholipid synthase
MAIHAAATRGCRVTTATISVEQHELAVERVRAAGLEDRIEVLLSDYRDLEGTYSKLVSLEMIEAVGWQYFPTYFRTCSRLLADDGAMFLQAIVIDDDAYEIEKASRSFANTHVFPGGCLPSELLIERLGADNSLPVRSCDDITASYARTLELWRERFNSAAPLLHELGYDDRFDRLWNFYLAFSEAGFRERRIRDLQIVLAKAERTTEGTGANRWRSRTRERAPAPL